MTVWQKPIWARRLPAPSSDWAPLKAWQAEMPGLEVPGAWLELTAIKCRQMFLLVMPGESDSG
jgi:hypothetical protein